MDCKSYRKLNTSLCILLIVAVLLCKGSEGDSLTTAAVKPDTFTTGQEDTILAEAQEMGKFDRVAKEEAGGGQSEEKDNSGVFEDAVPAETPAKEDQSLEPQATATPVEEAKPEVTPEAESIDSENTEAPVEPTAEPEPTGEPTPTAPITYQEVQAILRDPSQLNDRGIPYIAEIPTESNDARYEYITGRSYRAYTVGNMPEGFTSVEEASKQMVDITVPVWKMRSDGSRYSSTYTIPINSKLAISATCIFTEIYNLEIQFPFRYLAGFMYRKVGGVGLMNSKLMSAHAFGVAVDINPADEDNDYFLGKGNDLRDMSNPYCVTDEVIAIFEKYGWNWGGNFDICSDTMHFQYFGLEFLQYENPDEPFPILEYGSDTNNKAALTNLQERLVRLGYLEKTYSKFNSKVRSAVKSFQSDMGIPVTGKVTYGTWEPLINLTHDMGYVF